MVLEDAVYNLCESDMLKHFANKRHSLHNHVASAIALSVKLLVLCQSKHHLNHHEPDLFVRLQDFLWVTLDHFHKNLEHSLKKRNVGTVLTDENLQLDGINELLRRAEVSIVSHWDQVRSRVLQNSVDIDAELLEVANIHSVVLRHHAKLHLSLELHLFLSQQALLLEQSHTDVLV